MLYKICYKRNQMLENSKDTILFLLMGDVLAFCLQFLLIC